LPVIKLLELHLGAVGEDLVADLPLDLIEGGLLFLLVVIALDQVPAEPGLEDLAHLALAEVFEDVVLLAILRREWQDDSIA
jgi:hypothetical protein